MPPKKASSKEAEYDLELRFGRVKNSLKMGVVGLPNVGKSSLFNLLTKQSAEAANFPFCTIKPNEGRVQVPDSRYDTLCGMWKPPSEHPAYLGVTDIAGLVRGAADGAGLGNEFLSNISAVDGIFHVVRVFESDEVVHVDDCVDPVRDLDTITQELCLKDLAYLSSEEAKAHHDARKSQKVMPPAFVNTMSKVRELLEKRLILSKQVWTTIEVQKINEFLPALLTTKPVVYLLNMSTKTFVTKKSKWLAKVFAWIQEHGGGSIVPLSVDLEERLEEVRKLNLEGTDAAVREEIRQIVSECGIDLSSEEGKKRVDDEKSPAYIVSALPKIVKTGYRDLNLIQFFTTGPTEVRAWTVYKGATAPNCAGVIHSDMEKCFIKAEVVGYEDFVKNTPENNQKSMAGAKAAGVYRQEGKGYVVADGDILHIMHNAKK